MHLEFLSSKKQKSSGRDSPTFILVMEFCRFKSLGEEKYLYFYCVLKENECGYWQLKSIVGLYARASSIVWPVFPRRYSLFFTIKPYLLIVLPVCYVVYLKTALGFHSYRFGTELNTA